jgi:hypothetical protein
MAKITEAYRKSEKDRGYLEDRVVNGKAILISK